MTTHEYKVGRPVEFRPGRFAMPASSRDYKIVRLLPAVGAVYNHFPSDGGAFRTPVRTAELPGNPRVPEPVERNGPP
jgi:hypothetical protein